MQALVPRYLEFSMDHLTKDQGKLRDQMDKTFGPTAFHAVEDQVRTNMAFFTDAMRMWSPFVPPKTEGEVEKPSQPEPTPSDFETLKRQMAEMQEKLESLTKK
jgi:polyhydroxyalkanoate synthesis regulator protein